MSEVDWTMSPHGWFVWSAYGFTVVVMLGVALRAWRGFVGERRKLQDRFGSGE